MPAFYQSGTATDTHQLLNIVNTFLQSQLGWNLLQFNPLEKKNDSDNEAFHYRTYYYSNNGAIYFLSTGIEGVEQDFRTNIFGGVIEGHSQTGLTDEFDDGIFPHSFFDQEGFVYNFNMNEMEGPYTRYHLFGGVEGLDGEYCYLVVESSSGVYCHMGIGMIDRVGNTKAPFATSLYWNMSTSYWRSTTSSYHQRMFDSHSSYYGGRGHLSFHSDVDPVAPAPSLYLFGYSTDHAYGGSVGGTGQTSGGLNGAFVSDSPNAINARAMLQPNHILVDDGLSWKRIVGVAPAFRTIMIDHFQAEDVVDTDWMIFPIKSKNAPSGPSSGNYGWAYKFQ